MGPRAQRRTRHLTAATKLGWANALFLLVGSVMGVIASIGLLEAELTHLRAPSAVFECDFNPLVGCGSSLLSPQAHVLGIPNAVLGTVLFTAIATVAALALIRATIPRMAWWIAAFGAGGGVVTVLWFLYLSATTFHALCPYCLVVWSATLIIGSVLIPQALHATGHASIRSLGATLLRYTPLIAVALHLFIFFIIIIAMRDQIGALL
ncbi:MAG: vitamin K epoxide reductase family protein [Actinomycetaceae bacterium]|nr:vitamin K epoxide reductase family protein [Actinomycetaceae bacterium]